MALQDGLTLRLHSGIPVVEVGGEWSVTLTNSVAAMLASLQQAGHFDIVHFSGHAVANLRFPLLSRMLVAPSQEGAQRTDAITADDIGRHSFGRTAVVVLGSCEGAEGIQIKGEGVLNLAWPFLAAGVPIVIATFGDIEDRAARELFLRLHREMSRGTDPSTALRRAQLDMLRGPQPELRAAAAWGRVAAFGGVIETSRFVNERTSS